MPGFADICSMRILLIAATRAELAPTLSWLKAHDNQLGGHLVFTGTTGIGVLMSGWWLGRHLAEIHPQLVIQAGVAGSFHPDWKPGQAMAIQKDFIGDLGAWEGDNFQDVFRLGLLAESQPPFQEGWLVNPHARLLKESGLPLASAVTVNEISTDPKDIGRFQQRGALLETMEGAALHFACLQSGIPFIQIRTISNTVGVRDKRQWQLPAAIDSLNQYLQHWLPLLKSEWLCN
jgi:futalosine hydrolase